MTNNFRGKPIIVDGFIFLGAIEKTEENIFDLEIPDEILENLETQNDDPTYYSLDEYNNNFNLDTQGKSAFFSTRIHFATYEQIACIISFRDIGKLWIDREKILCRNEIIDTFISMDFHQGIHEIIVEFRDLPHVTIRLSKLQEELSGSPTAFFSQNFSVNQNYINVIHEDINCKAKSNFHFLLQSNNHIDTPKKVTMRLFDRFNRLLLKKQIELGTVINIDLTKYKKKAYYNYCLIYIEITCDYINTAATTCFYVLTRDLYNRAKKYYLKLQRKIEECKGVLSSFEKLQLDSILENMRSDFLNQDDNSLFWNMDLVRFVLKQMRTNASRHFLYTPNGTERCFKSECVHELYFQSKLDAKKEIIRLYVPEDYDQNQAYPLFVILSTVQYGFDSCVYKAFDKCNFIVADVTARGVTLGSYMGEASILECIDVIKNTYSINEDKIYFLGYSNGGYGVYSIAQNHPDLSAGIYPLGACPYIQNIKNLTNTHIVNFVSDSDPIFARNRTREQIVNNLFDFEKYREFIIEKYCHGSTIKFLANTWVVQYLLDKTLEKFPSKILFRTERNRHNKAFWIQLGEIQYGKNSMEINAETIDEKHIKISAENCTGFSITIPPQIDKKNFEIEVNNETTRFNNFSNAEVHFVNVSNTYKLSEIGVPLTQSRKGTGLLDVYLNSLRILIPENSSPFVRQAAEQFASPYTNTYIPQVHTNYPIFHTDSISEVIQENNLIIFDDGTQEPHTSALKSLLHIKTTAAGFEYKGQKRTGEYCIMQIIPNPANSIYSILFIQTNNVSILNKNLFTRTVGIPTYVNGIDTFWNNEALILFENVYHRVYEWDRNMEKIT